MAKKQPGKQPPQQNLIFGKTPHGDVTIEGLRPGLFEVAADLIGMIAKMSSEGRLYPFIAQVETYDPRHDLYMVRIKEG